MEIPPCPDPAHAGSRVVRAGWYGKAPHRRQRWLCQPPNGYRPHRFSEVLPRRESQADLCPRCSTVLEPWEGQPVPRGYSFAASEIAHALALVAHGESYRRSAQAVRALAQREIDASNQALGLCRRRIPDYDGQLVANFVDVFAPILLEQALAKEWPEELVVDSTEFKVNHGAKQGASYHVFCAVGYVLDGYLRKPRLWRMEAFGSKSEASWKRFFRSLPGRPRVVVTDMYPPVRNAARAVFERRDPTPLHLHMCEYHLRERLLEALAPLQRIDPSHAVFAAAERALLYPDAWERFLDLVYEADKNVVRLPVAIRWLDRYGVDLAAQVDTRSFASVHSVGPIESYIRKLRDTLSERARVLGNRRRTNLLLGLLTAGFNGDVDELAWAETIRSHLATYGGYPLAQRRHDDPAGMPSLFIP